MKADHILLAHIKYSILLNVKQPEWDIGQNGQTGRIVQRRDLRTDQSGPQTVLMSVLHGPIKAGTWIPDSKQCSNGLSEGVRRKIRNCINAKVGDFGCNDSTTTEIKGNS